MKNITNKRKVFILIVFSVTVLVFVAVLANEFQKHEMFYSISIDSVKDGAPGNRNGQSDEYAKQMKDHEEEMAKNKLFQEELKALLPERWLH
jgi:hypothetical protein